MDLLCTNLLFDFREISGQTDCDLENDVILQILSLKRVLESFLNGRKCNVGLNNLKYVFDISNSDDKENLKFTFVSVYVCVKTIII